MSGSRGPSEPATRDGAARRLPARPQLPLFDRLIDDTPDRPQDAALSASELMAALQRSVRLDMEALLNARRRWRSWPPGLKELATSPLGYGIPDCTGGVFHGDAEREVLRLEIEDTIRRFEPRFRSVRVIIAADDGKLTSTLRLRIEALLHAEPAPEPVAFDMVVDPTTADVVVRIDAES